MIKKFNKKKSFFFFNSFFFLRYLNFTEIFKEKKIKNKIILNAHFKSLHNKLLNIYKILQKGYIIKLLLKGLGYNIYNQNNQFLKININYSHSIIFKIKTKIKFITTKNFIYLYGFSKDLLYKYSYLLYKLKKLNNYKNVGILLPNFKYKYKAGKKKKK